MSERLKHGTVSSETGMVFWSYDSDGRETWLSPERFKARRESAKKNAKIRYWKDVEKSRASLRKWHHENKELKAENYKKWASKNKAKIRDKRLFRVYGLTNEDYFKLQQKQGNVCAICKCPQYGGEGRLLCVDHCHETNEVRELLCTKCNAGLGQFLDDPTLLENAAKYLKKHQK